MKILIATDSYLNMPTANGICCEEICEEFIKRGDKVFVLCFKHPKDKQYEVINNTYIYRIRMDVVNTLRYAFETRKDDRIKLFLKRMMMFINRLEAMIFLHWFPMRTPLFTYRYYRKIKRIYKKERIDLIISSYCPFEAIWSMSIFKRKNPHVKTCMYNLDSLTNLKQRFFMSADFQEKKGWAWEKRLYKNCDLILNLKCHEKHYSKERYKSFKDKMRIVDIPHIINRNMRYEKKYTDLIRIVYAGALRDDIVSDVIDILSPFLIENMVELLFYGRSTVDSIIKHCNNPQVLKNIKFMGQVSHEEILSVESEADVLLSMGNYNTDFIPSKVFEYISLGGKVLHIYNYKKDPVIPYMRKYRNGCFIDVADDLFDNQAKVRRFLLKDSERVPFDEIERDFEMNTPKYTVSQIVKMLGVKRE